MKAVKEEPVFLRIDSDGFSDHPIVEIVTAISYARSTNAVVKRFFKTSKVGDVLFLGGGSERLVRLGKVFRAVW